MFDVRACCVSPASLWLPLMLCLPLPRCAAAAVDGVFEEGGEEEETDELVGQVRCQLPC